MAKTEVDHVTLAYCALGSTEMRPEEERLRLHITRKVAPSNKVIMAYPYPRSWGVDRSCWLRMYVNDVHTVEYVLVIKHECLLWIHTRVITLTCEEFVSVAHKLAVKYGAPKFEVYERTNSMANTTITHSWRLPRIDVGEER